MAWEPKEDPINPPANPPANPLTNPNGTGSDNADDTATTDQIEAKTKALYYWVIPEKSQAKVASMTPEHQRYVAVEYRKTKNDNATIGFIQEKWWTWYLRATGKLTDIDEAKLPDILDKPNVKALDPWGVDVPIKIPGQGMVKMQALCALLRNCVTVAKVRNEARKKLTEAKGRPHPTESDYRRRIRHFADEEIKYDGKFFGYAFIFDAPWDVTNLPVANQRYVKLKTADVRPIMATTKDVYMPVNVIQAWAGGIDPKTPLSTSKAGLAEALEKYNKDAMQKGGNRKKFNIHEDREQFYVRDEEGQPFFVDLDSRYINSDNDPWEARFRNAVNSIEDEKGWNRFLNPKIDLYIVPIGTQPNLEEHVKTTKKRLGIPIDGSPALKTRTCAQDVTVLQTVTYLPKADGGPGTVRINGGELGTLVKVGRSPFHDYETYVKESDWKSYTSLRISRKPGKEGVVAEAEKNLIKARLKYTAAKTQKLDALKKAAEIGRGNAATGLNDALTEEQKKKQEENLKGNVISVRATAGKIYAAAGRRSEAPDQKEIMGDSATKVAEKIGWENDKMRLPSTDKRWPGTSHAMAEWLHRCAFSWGGLGNSGSAFKTSQVSNNLIFGSSETNSLMTRYEKAWQSLVTKENALRTGQNKGKQKSYLVSQILPMEKEKYELDFADETKNDLPEYKTIPSWLCYKMRYALHVHDYEGLEGRKNSIFETYFYPFQRPFFTKFEQELDIVFLDAMYKRAGLTNNAEAKDAAEQGQVDEQQGQEDEQPENPGTGPNFGTIPLESVLSRKMEDVSKWVMPEQFKGQAFVDHIEDFEYETMNMAQVLGSLRPAKGGDKSAEWEEEKPSQSKLQDKIDRKKKEEEEARNRDLPDPDHPNNDMIEEKNKGGKKRGGQRPDEDPEDEPATDKKHKPATDDKDHTDNSMEEIHDHQTFSMERAQTIDLESLPRAVAVMVDEDREHTANEERKEEPALDNGEMNDHTSSRVSNEALSKSSEPTTPDSDFADQSSNQGTNDSALQSQMTSQFEGFTEMQSLAGALDQKLIQPIETKEERTDSSSLSSSSDADSDSVFDDDDESSIPLTEAALAEHELVWKELSEPGATLVNGLLLSNAQMVTTTPIADDVDTTEPAPLELARSDDLSLSVETSSKLTPDPSLSLPTDADAAAEETPALVVSEEHLEMLAPTDIAFEEVKVEAIEASGLAGRPAPSTVPNEYVLKGDFMLFGVMPVQLYSLQSLTTPGDTFRITFTDELSLGKLVPSLADSPMNAIKLSNTNLTFKTVGTKTERAGLTVKTTVHFSGFLQPVATVLRDIFGQNDPRVDMSCLLSTQADALRSIPQPVGFTLRGVLPQVDINLFGVLKITDIGIDLIGMRQNAKGDYKYAYGFFGAGAISDVRICWYINKYDKFYRISIFTESDEWKNVFGVSGFNLQNVLFEADWMGTDISSVALQLQASFVLKSGHIMLRGVYSKEHMELAGVLENCSLETLKALYEDITGSTLDFTTNHKVEFSTLAFIVSNKGIALRGAVEIDDHVAAEASIAIGAEGIHISGSVSGFSVGEIQVIEPAISVTILRGFNFQLSGRVKVTDKHVFDVSVYVNKSSGESIEYTVYGAYQGEFHTRSVVSALEGTFLDVTLEQVAVCFSNMDNPQINVVENIAKYPIKKGLQVYAQTSKLEAVKDVLRLSDPKLVTVCAYWAPGGNKMTDSSFGINIILGSTDLISFDSVKSGPLTMGVEITRDRGPRLNITAALYIEVSERSDPLELELELKADSVGAEGSAAMIGKWDNPLGKCKQMSIADLIAGLGIQYAQFFATGTPSSLTLGGKFELYDFKGSMLLHVGTSSQQLISLDIQNLDVAKLVKFIANLLDINLNIPDSKDTFYIRKLLIYLSTGMTVKGWEYPRGIKLDADMTIFGKKATLFAEVVETHVKFKGTIEKFKLGDFEVRGARAEDPSINLEISKAIQKISIDGKIIFKENIWIAVVLDIDTGNGTFFFYFDLKIADALRVTITASLDSPMPKAIEGTNPDGSPKLIESGVSGALSDKEFNVSAKMEQDIMKFLTDLANKHLEEEGDPNRKAELQTKLNEATAAWQKAKEEFEKEEARLKGIIETKTQAIAAEFAKVGDERSKAQSAYDKNMASKEQNERDLKSRLDTQVKQLEEQEALKDVEVAQAMANAWLAVETCRMEWKMLSFAKETAQGAKESRDLVEDDLAQFEIKCDKDKENEPPRDSIAHPPWGFARTALIAELETKRAAARKAANDYTTALVAHDAAAFETTSARLEELNQAAKKAQEVFNGREAAKAAAIAKGQEDAADQLRRFQKQFEEHAAGLKKMLDLAIKKEAESKTDSEAAQEKVRKDNAVGGSAQYEDMRDKHSKMTNAKTAFESFSNLVNVLSLAGAIVTAPLRYCIKALGESILNIKKVEISGKFGKSTGKVKAHIEGMIAFVWQSFDLEIDVSNVVSFFTGLWGKIKDVISTIGGAIQNLVKQGIEAVKKFVEEAKNGIHHVIDETEKFVDNAGKVLENLGRQIESGFDDVKDTVGGVVGDINRDIDGVARDVDRGLQDVSRGLDGFGRDLKRGFEDFGRDLQRGIDEFGRSLIGGNGDDERRRKEEDRGRAEMMWLSEFQRGMEQKQKEMETEFMKRQDVLRQRATEIKVEEELINFEVAEKRKKILESFEDRYGPVAADLPELKQELLEADMVEARRAQWRQVQRLEDDMAELTIQRSFEQERLNLQVKFVQHYGRRGPDVPEFEEQMHNLAGERDRQLRKMAIQRRRRERDEQREMEEREWKRKAKEDMARARDPEERDQIAQDLDRDQRRRMERYEMEDMAEEEDEQDMREQEKIRNIRDRREREEVTRRFEEDRRRKRDIRELRERDRRDAENMQTMEEDFARMQRMLSKLEQETYRLGDPSQAEQAAQFASEIREEWQRRRERDQEERGRRERELTELNNKEQELMSQNPDPRAAYEVRQKIDEARRGRLREFYEWYDRWLQSDGERMDQWKQRLKQLRDRLERHEDIVIGLPVVTAPIQRRSSPIRAINDDDGAMLVPVRRRASLVRAINDEDDTPGLVPVMRRAGPVRAINDDDDGAVRAPIMRRASPVRAINDYDDGTMLVLVTGRPSLVRATNDDDDIARPVSVMPRTSLVRAINDDDDSARSTARLMASDDVAPAVEVPVLHEFEMELIEEVTADDESGNEQLLEAQRRLRKLNEELFMMQATN